MKKSHKFIFKCVVLFKILSLIMQILTLKETAKYIIKSKNKKSLFKRMF